MDHRRGRSSLGSMLEGVGPTVFAVVIADPNGRLCEDLADTFGPCTRLPKKLDAISSVDLGQYVG